MKPAHLLFLSYLSKRTRAENLVDKIKFISNRPELSLNEVLDQYECTVADLFHVAANGDLTIYYQAPSTWKAKYVCSSNQIFIRSMLGMENELSEHEFNYFLEMCPELKDIISRLNNGQNEDEIADEVAKAINRFSDKVDLYNGLPPAGFQEVFSIGPFTYYPDKGRYRALFISPLVGLSPVSPITIQQYRNGIDKEIWLKLSDSIGISDNSNEEYFVMTEPTITITAALKANKLFVIKEDIRLLLSQDSQDHPTAKPKISGVAKGTRASTLERYADWQSRADEKIKKYPSLSAYAVAESIYKDLQGEGSKFLRSVDAIRQHIKI